MKKVLIMGSTGMLGSACESLLRKNADINLITTARDDVAGSLKFNALSDDVKSLLDFVKPDAIINCVGIIKPHIKEDVASSVSNAIKVNSVFPFQLAESTDVPIIQIATDCVFSGLRGEYRESDLHDANDVYGKTKSLGEVNASNVFNIRVSIIGPEIGRSTSLLEWFIHQPHGASLNGFEDHLWNGVTTLHFARIAEGIILNEYAEFELAHVVPQDVVTKAQLLRIFADAYNRKDLDILDVTSSNSIDRTLSTNDLERNIQLWQMAGYDLPPSIEQMVHEQAAKTV